MKIHSPKVLVFSSLAWAGALAGCGGDGDTDMKKPPAAVDTTNLGVDSNRDGVVTSDDSDQVDEDRWNATVGAIFLANLDDDDDDGDADGQDDEVNGSDDEEDLARVIVYGWPEAPDGAAAALTLDAASRAHVRLFRSDGDGAWTYLAGGDCDIKEDDADDDDFCAAQVLALSLAQIRSGLEIGIEGIRFYGNVESGWTDEDEPGWDGLVRLTYAVTDAAGMPLGNEVNPEAIDRVKLRVAPWLVNHNLRPFDTAYYSDFSNLLTATLDDPLEEFGVEPIEIPGYDDIDDYEAYSDIWTEDWMLTGWTAMPKLGGPAGEVHGMNIFNPRPWGRPPQGEPYEPYLPLAFLNGYFLGPDQGVAVFYDEERDTQGGDTFDSHGNHEALPPWPAAPAGRILVGSNVLESTRTFYAAQGVQPPVYLTTDWLIVGHMDEVYTEVRAAGETGFKLLQNTPQLAMELFADWEDQGMGEATLFEGLVDPFNDIEWETTLAEVNSDPTMMAWNQESQAFIEQMQEELIKETGLTTADIVEVPVLYEEIGGGKIAYIPDTANVRVIGEGEVVIFTQTFGPTFEGTDLMTEWLEDNIGTPVNALGADGQGVEVRFADSWHYHILLGDVHCASNWTVLPTAGEPKWWAASPDNFEPEMPAMKKTSEMSK